MNTLPNTIPDTLPYTLHVILLAAGKSSRFEDIKLIAPVNVQTKIKTKIKTETINQVKSTPLIQHVFENLMALVAKELIKKGNLHIATGEYHEKLLAVIDKKLSIIHCPEAHLGVGHTIAQSVENVIHPFAGNIKDNDADSHNQNNSRDTRNTTDIAKASHIMITLADQIALTTDDYIQLINQSRLTPDKLVCAKVGTEIMPPAIFPSHYFSQLLTLIGDKGAKAILFKNKDNLTEVILPNAAIDIDSKQDLVDWHRGNAFR